MKNFNNHLPPANAKVERLLQTIAIMILFLILLLPFYGNAQSAVSPEAPKKAVPVGTVVWHHYAGAPLLDNSPAAEQAKAILTQYEKAHEVKVITQADYDQLLTQKGQDWIDARPVPYEVKANQTAIDQLIANQQ